MRAGKCLLAHDCVVILRGAMMRPRFMKSTSCIFAALLFTGAGLHLASTNVSGQSCDVPMVLSPEQNCKNAVACAPLGCTIVRDTNGTFLFAYKIDTNPPVGDCITPTGSINGCTSCQGKVTCASGAMYDDNLCLFPHVPATRVNMTINGPKCWAVP